MEAPPRPIRFRRWTLAVALLAFPALSGCLALPRLDQALAEAAAPAQTTKVYARDGSLIAELHAEEDREVVSLSVVPQALINAVLAIEDARFYEHSGVDFQGVLRALGRNASEGRVVEGGSTITQQLVKNTLVERERTLKRKVREAVLAYQLEQRFSKEEILERYLNTVYFGRGAYGVQAAAETFFSKDVSKLRLPEAAMLAGMIRSPSLYDPRTPETARNRRNVVLRRMLDEGMITEGAYERARSSSLGMRFGKDSNKYPYGYFVDYVKEMIFDGEAGLDVLGETRAERINAVFKGGLRIHTTLDPRLQNVAEDASRRILPGRRDPRNAFVGVRPGTGQILTMVGGRGFFGRDRFAKLNLAVRHRQPGSSFKTFTLVAAVSQGIPLTKVYGGGSRITLTLPNGQVWSPANYDLTSYGSMTVKSATAFSVNVVYAQMILEVGPHKVVNLARKMGIDSPLEPVHSIALGTEEVTPLEMAEAYATLANEGVHVDTTPFRRITDAAGNVLYKPKQERKRVLPQPVAALATEALVGVMENGFSRGLSFGRPSAGKSGTSESHADAWFAGYTPQLVGVSWMGFPQGRIPMVPPRTRVRVNGSAWPGEVWKAWMIAGHRGKPSRDFPEAEDALVKVRIDTSRGCLPNAFTPPYLIEERSYLRGTEPTEVCTEPTSGRIPSTPDVLGESSGEARRTLERAGFAVSTVGQYCPAFQPGTVCDQSPAPGTPASVGTRATLFVSDDSAVDEVPMVLGLPLDRARQKLADYGYRISVVTRANTGGFSGCRDSFESRSGRVWLQQPCAGERYGRGSTVTVYVVP